MSHMCFLFVSTGYVAALSPHCRPTATVLHTAIAYDTQTEPPVLLSPVTGSYLQDPFVVNFTLREPAEAGSLLLKIIPTSIGESDPEGTRTLTLTAAMEVFGNRQFLLGPLLSTAATTNSPVVGAINPR